MSRHAHEQSLHRWTPQKAKPRGMEAQIRAVLFFGNWRTCMLKWQCQEGWSAGLPRITEWRTRHSPSRGHISGPEQPL